MIVNVDLCFEKNGNRECLAYGLRSNSALNMAAVKLLENNIVDGVLPFSFEDRDGSSAFLYNTSGKVVIEDYLMDILNQGKLYKLFRSMANTLLEAKEYGMSCDYFTAIEKSIFVDPLTDKIWMIYLPLKEEGFEQISIRDFIRGAFNLVKYDYRSDGEFFIKLNNYIKSGEDFSIEEFKDKLDSLFGIRKANVKDEEEYVPPKIFNEEKAAIPKENKVEEPDNKEAKSRGLQGFFSFKKEDKKTNITEIEEEFNYRKITRKPSNDFSDEDNRLDNALNFQQKSAVDSDDDALEGETSVLGEEEDMCPYLTSSSGNERFDIDRELIKIGRDGASVDFAITSPAVGRIHGEISSEDGEYYIRDNNSTNGTFLNSSRLEGNKKYKIKHGDKIRFANKEFIFRIY